MTAAPLEMRTSGAAQAMGLDAATAVAEAFKVLSDPLRLRMLSAIATDPRRECCVGDLADLANVSQPTVSHHLKLLKDAGVLESQRRGTWVWYRIVAAKQAAVTALLDGLATLTTEPAHDQPRSPRKVDARMIDRLAADLATEYENLERDLVVAVVRDSYVGLLGRAHATRQLAPITERFARQRLTDLTRDHASGAPQVLFVCVHNAGRSQIAAALVNQMSNGTVITRSAGSRPAPEVHPHVRSLLATIEGERAAAARFPKPLTDDAVRAADVVVMMGCGDVCPIIPGVEYEDWAVGDPALASPAGVEAIRDDIAARARVLVDSLTANHRNGVSA